MRASPFAAYIKMCYLLVLKVRNFARIEALIFNTTRLYISLKDGVKVQRRIAKTREPSLL